MTTLREIEPLKFKHGETYSLAASIDDLSDGCQVYLEQDLFTADEALALHEWLSRALGLREIEP